MPELFDTRLRALRRDRASKVGPELFLFERAFEDCVERISLLQRQFDRALLLGCPDADWPARLRDLARNVETLDPGPLFAAAAQGMFRLREGTLPRRHRPLAGWHQMP